MEAMTRIKETDLTVGGQCVGKSYAKRVFGRPCMLTLRSRETVSILSILRAARPSGWALNGWATKEGNTNGGNGHELGPLKTQLVK